ncbi:hypothetical protein Bbelb_350470 [Branchiostoma belcheri]|nr:hypothetical protein Bbelb_350470 [Branchiostoma belcheri]
MSEEGNQAAVVQIGGDIGSLPSFAVGGDSSSVAVRWKKWKRSFALYLKGKGVEDDGQKKALLLHTAGAAVQDIYFTQVKEEDDKKKYDETVGVLDAYFIPKSNVAFERHMFRQVRQQDGETIDDLVCRLRQKASTCDFGGQVDVHIRDQVIEAGLDPKLKRKFLERGGDLELGNMLDIARAHEAVGRQLQEMTGQVNAMSMGHKKDFRGTTHRGPPSFGGKKTLPRSPRGLGPGRLGNPRRQEVALPVEEPCAGAREVKKSSSTCNSVEGETDPGTDHYVFSMGGQAQKRAGTIDVEIGGVGVAGILIDSGATCNIISKGTWESLKGQRVEVRDQRKGGRNLYTYGSNKPLPTLGTFKAEVVCLSNAAVTEAEVVVMDGPGRNLLSKETAEKLGVLRVGPVQTGQVNILQEGLTAEEREKYKDAFTGVGLLKGREVTLHIDETVRPIAQPLRRVPYGLRDKVDKKLDELLEMDIIEVVPEEPTGWVSPLVVVPKPDGDIRVCVDMRRANEAIVRERQPIPTVEDVLHDLNGSTVFSKLDLKWGFHQVPLKKESRHITTFVTHRGLYRYKRLMFGISSAPEKYQQLVKEVLRGCEGVANIADDVIIHGRGNREHDERLHHALDKIQQAGLTVNPEKCLFRVPKLTFFGHVVTPDGVKPSDEKIAAIRDAEAPKTAGEVRSFLGLVHYVAKFVPDLATLVEPLQKLTRKGVEFKWNSEQEESFKRLKEKITSTETLAYFAPTGKTRIVADASPVGLGAVLLQLQEERWRVIAYASRQLSEVERRYSQTEKEALALVWACERFHLYTFGREFELETDHRPLKHIYTRTSKPSARVERWVLRLQAYPFKVVYRPGKTNIADALSRLNNKSKNGERGEDYDYVEPSQCTTIIVRGKGSPSLPQILQLLRAYHIFTGPFPNVEFACMFESQIRVLTQQLRVSYFILHIYHGPASEMFYMLELYRQAMRTRTTIRVSNINGPFGEPEILQNLRSCTVTSEWLFTNTVVLDHATGISFDFVEPTECVVATCSNTCSTPRAHVVITCARSVRTGSEPPPEGRVPTIATTMYKILHLLETYGVFTDASPTPETVCLTDAVVITATRHLRATYSIQHRYEGPPSEMLYMLELHRRAMLTRTTILKTHLDGPCGQRLMYMRHIKQSDTILSETYGLENGLDLYGLLQTTTNGTEMDYDFTDNGYNSNSDHRSPDNSKSNILAKIVVWSCSGRPLGPKSRNLPWVGWLRRFRLQTWSEAPGRPDTNATNPWR